MATRPATIDYIIKQVAQSVPASARKMFGEYALYVEDKVVGLVCDDQLFMKPTEAGRSFIGNVVEAPAFAGAKPSFLIARDRLEDRAWLGELMHLTARALPLAKVKTKRRER